SADEETKRRARRETLAALLKETKNRTRKVVFGVPGQSVFVRTRPLPPVPEHKVTQIVRYEIQQQIPFGLDQIALDYQVLSRTEAGGYDVLMAAIKVDVVDKWLDAVREAKRQIDIVDVCPFAAYNWLKYTGEFGEQGESVALIDLGATTTDIVIEREGQFRFVRSVNLGGNDVTAALANAFGTTFYEAEKLKRERGFAPTGDAQHDGKGGQVIGDVLGRLVGEIARSFSFFRSQPGGGPVTRVVVTGGGACLRNMIPYLERQLAMEVRIAQPLAGLAIAPSAQEVNEHPERAAVALGLSLRTLDAVPIAINLIPPAILALAKQREQIFYWLLSVAALVLIVASVIPIKEQENAAVREYIKQVETAIIGYDASLARGTAKSGDTQATTSRSEADLNVARNRVAEEKNKLDTLDSLRRNRKFWLDYLNVINNARPKGNKVWISRIETTHIGAMPQQRGGAPVGGSVSSGFPGIQPPAGGGSQTAAGAGSLRSSTQTAAAVGPPPGNGIIIAGYALTPQDVTDFKVALEKSFPKVDFNDAFANRVSVTELDNAQNVSGGGASVGGAPAPWQYAAGQTVTSFRIEVTLP
ncbi:MAG TPA: type IV pilus assembly protein PilM, partial [Candidatus Hydrogenedentes bacterium]|nr:type IV pilus assembly protein PilM [Candidatus Hydrogenedentota bacterium]